MCSLCKNSLGSFALFCMYVIGQEICFEKGGLRKEPRWKKQNKLNIVDKFKRYKL